MDIPEEDLLAVREGIYVVAVEEVMGEEVFAETIHYFLVELVRMRAEVEGATTEEEACCNLPRQPVVRSMWVAVLGEEGRYCVDPSIEVVYLMDF